ncbi:hypothetical protein ADENT20671_1164 [Actinomyces denticolens]|nr:hypothetical protein ADENT20671_1164 [Actinomyces denticolens]
MVRATPSCPDRRVSAKAPAVEGSRAIQVAPARSASDVGTALPGGRRRARTHRGSAHRRGRGGPGQGAGVALQEEEIELTAPQAGQARALLDLLDDDVESGAIGLQVGDERQEDGAHRGGEGADADRPGGARAVETGELALGLGELALDALGTLGQHPTGLREDRAGRGAIHETGIALLLQKADVLGDGGGTHM